MTSVFAPFLSACERHPDRIALIDRDGTTRSYAALREEAAALAASWRARGLQPGQRVLVAHPVSIALYRALIATWFAGCAAVFPEPFAGLKGLRHARALLTPSAAVSNGLGRLLLPFLAGGGMRMLSPDPGGAGPNAPAPPSDIALYSFTSGSTGAPKCIPRSHGFLLAQSAAVSRVLASERHEVDLVWFPVFVLACLANGATAVLADSALKRPGKPDTGALARQARAHGVTRLLVPPTVALALAHEPAMPKLGTVFTGGGPVMPHHFSALSRIGEETVAIYGSTEAEPIATLSSRDISEADWTAMAEGGGLLAGQVAPGLALRIVEDEIQVAGDHVVETYLDPAHNAENKLLEDGRIWHRTGDGGRLDAQGRLWLRGRLKGRVGGLWPLEIEARAATWPGVDATALASRHGEPVLAIAGDRAHEALWQAEAARLGISALPVSRIPMDRRHASKVDFTRLDALIRRRRHR